MAPWLGSSHGATPTSTKGGKQLATINDEALERLSHLLVRRWLQDCPPATTPAHEQAIREAEVAQVRYWAANDITPGAENVQTTGKVVASSSLLGASMTYADTAEARVKARERAAETLCLEARLILGLAGLNPQPPLVVG